MKSLVRWSATLSILGGVLFGSLSTGDLRALALSEEEIVQKLRSVPVFTVTDGEGSPLVASISNEGNDQNASVAGVFISQQDAVAFVDRLKQENPELGNQVQVTPVPLGEVYRLDKANQSQPQGLDFAYIPMQEQVESAQELVGQEFQGTPLFVARDSEDQGYLTIEQNGQQVIPMFFEIEQIQGLVENLKAQQPELGDTVEIQAVPLEGVIQTLQDSDNEYLKNILLIPSRESMEFLRSLPGDSNSNTP